MLILLLLADAVPIEFSLFKELTSGATGIALGIIISGSFWLFYRIRYELPRQDAQNKAKREETEALTELARSIWVLISGSTHHTDASKDDARRGIERIDSGIRKKP